MNTIQTTAAQIVLLACFSLASAETPAGQTGPAGAIIPFSSDLWTIVNGSETELFGRRCFMGIAMLDDAEFSDGVIEVEVAADGRRSYPGIIFRKQSDLDYERFYIRPHRAGLYPDALQYTPVFNRVAGWQLYSGPGFTNSVEIPEKEWFRVRLEVLGSQARVFVGDAGEPDLVIPNLKHGASSGALGLMGPADGTACFANFAYHSGLELNFSPPPPAPKREPGTINHWEISQIFVAKEIDREKHPDQVSEIDFEWREAATEPGGLLDFARHVQRTGGAESVYARASIHASEKKVVRFSFGYSDEIDLFLNGRKVFSGRSAYRYRDPSFVGRIGLFDDVYLPLEPGRNEVLALVTESFGGWGLIGHLSEEPEAPH